MQVTVQKFDKVYYFVSFIVPIIADRITKYLMLAHVWQSHEVNRFFNLYLTYNHGIAWGLGSQLHQSQFSWLTLLVALVLIYFLWYMRFIAHNRNMMIACLLVLAGGFSNFFDRLWYGSVVDFIQLHVADWYFPVFNVADVSISLGAVLLIYFVMLDDTV